MEKQIKIFRTKLKETESNFQAKANFLHHHNFKVECQDVTKRIKIIKEIIEKLDCVLDGKEASHIQFDFDW